MGRRAFAVDFAWFLAKAHRMADVQDGSNGGAKGAWDEWQDAGCVPKGWIDPSA
eukprot:gene39935-60870_t